MSDPVQPLIEECWKQASNCAYTSASFTIWLRCLRWVRLIAHTTPIVFGALATWKIVETAPTWAAVFTLLATAIPPVYRASKYDAEIEDYTTLAGEFTNLRDRFRQAATISSQKPFSDFEADFRPLMARLEKARGRTLTPPEWCFRLAQRKIKKGDYAGLPPPASDAA